MKKQDTEFVVLMWICDERNDQVQKLWSGPHATRKQAQQALNDWRALHGKRLLRGQVEAR